MKTNKKKNKQKKDNSVLKRKKKGVVTDTEPYKNIYGVQ